MLLRSPHDLSAGVLAHTKFLSACMPARAWISQNDTPSSYIRPADAPLRVACRDVIIHAMNSRASLAVLLVSIFFITLAALFFFLRVTTPSDGARILSGRADAWQPNGVAIAPIVEQPSGLRDGDVVIAIDGRALESYAETWFDWRAPRPQWRVGQTLTYTLLRDGRAQDVPVTLTRYPFWNVLAREWGVVVFALSFVLVAAFVFFKRPDERAARVLFLMGIAILTSTPWSFGLQVSDLTDGIGLWLHLATTMGAYNLLWLGALHFALVFPRPAPLLLSKRWLIPLMYVAPYVFLAVALAINRARAASVFDWHFSPGNAVGIVETIYLSLAIVAGIRAYRAAKDTTSHQQIRWFAFAALVSGVAAFAFGMIPQLVWGRPLLDWNALSQIGILIPIALAFAILRYRLFDIDVIINRALVYGALTLCTMGLYVLIIGYLGNFLQSTDRSLIAFLTTGFVAVIFQPLRERLQRAVNRLLYGERDDPYAVLARLSQRLESTLAPDAVLPTIVETVAHALKLPYAAIALTTDDGRPQTAASFPPSAVGGPPSDGLRLPLIYQAETIGQLILAPRAPNEPFSSADQRLLADIARQTGIAAHAVRLTADLQRSREQLVAAREEERRRIRRDLHDGLGPALAGLMLKLDATRNLIDGNPRAATALIDELKTQTQAALGDIRRLVYALRPPALDELGLASAIREQAAQYNSADGLRVTVNVPEHLPPLPAAVEVAAYRIATEALTNVARHARARECAIRLELDRDLEIEIRDDGMGLPRSFRAGVGLASMRERAAELGGTCVIEASPDGGTRVAARLPLNG